MSAPLDAADAERKRAQETIRLEEEETKKRKPESPESASMQIAEEARKRIALEEAGRAANLKMTKQEKEEAVKEGRKTHANGAMQQPTRQVQTQTRVDQVQDQASVTSPNDKNPRSPTSPPGMYFRPQESPLLHK